MTLHSLLTPEQQSFLSAEREIIQELMETLANWETPTMELEHLRQALNQLNELFLLVFLGGLALNLTPCVYPVIPITIGFFASQANEQDTSSPHPS